MLDLFYSINSEVFVSNVFVLLKFPNLPLRCINGFLNGCICNGQCHTGCFLKFPIILLRYITGFLNNCFSKSHCHIHWSLQSFLVVLSCITYHDQNHLSKRKTNSIWITLQFSAIIGKRPNNTIGKNEYKDTIQKEALSTKCM